MPQSPRSLRAEPSGVRIPPAGAVTVPPRPPLPDTADEPAAATIAVTRGRPTSEELAAVLIALRAVTAAAAAAPARPASRERPWSNEQPVVARTVPGAWGPGPRVVTGPPVPGRRGAAAGHLSGAPANRSEGRTPR
ncbi:MULTISPECIES: acyl-CoA carboxylase epsilon subunit [Protofrankia]|uniref:Peptidase C14, caspase catalytic subunit P20 n=1 Tax=Candidatus Protofrankia datiscae TaxID=2716812 RepID=F8AXM1_9ACTN|nr:MULTISPECIES: acyl-CoA carboxylase epsilon subunit [Protofrankia]AEH10372.1 peptidase C14, caspase catalytic subunit P20 [Candidatus Protofrankia datiscae]